VVPSSQLVMPCAVRPASTASRHRTPSLAGSHAAVRRRCTVRSRRRRSSSAADVPPGRTVPAHHAVELPAGHGHPHDRPRRSRPAARWCSPWRATVRCRRSRGTYAPRAPTRRSPRRRATTCTCCRPGRAPGSAGIRLPSAGRFVDHAGRGQPGDSDGRQPGRLRGVRRRRHRDHGGGGGPVAAQRLRADHLHALSESITHLSAACLTLAERCVSGITANTEAPPARTAACWGARTPHTRVELWWSGTVVWSA
jgi:hypothetical protein